MAESAFLVILGVLQLFLLACTLSLEDSIQDDIISLVCDGKSDGLYSFPQNCSRYISCKTSKLGKNIRSVKECAPHNHFHPAYEVCVWEKIYPCSKTGKPLPVATSPAVRFCRDREPGVYADPVRCNGYMICTNEGAYHMKCPKGFQFSSLKNKCVNTPDAKCKRKSSTQSPRKDEVSRKQSITTVQILYTKSKTSKLSCEGKKSGKYHIPGACSYFYECSNKGEASVKQCKKHRNFHPIYKTCVWTHMYACVDQNFCAGKSNGKHVNSNNCYGYYHCVDNLTFPQNCKPGLRFNKYECVDASRYICPPPVKLNVLH